jgi:hypothetical protein
MTPKPNVLQNLTQRGFEADLRVGQAPAERATLPFDWTGVFPFPAGIFAPQHRCEPVIKERVSNRWRNAVHSVNSFGPGPPPVLHPSFPVHLRKCCRDQ